MRARLLASLIAFTGQLALAAQPVVTESARKIPVAEQVDVVVVGGSTGAVSAAVEAAKQGAKVFLAAPRPYLGDDVAGTLRLWLEEGETPASPLARSIFACPREPLAALGNVLPATYEADLPAAGAHRDTKPPSLLSDGQWHSAAAQSVQYDGDVSIVLDLSKRQRVEKAIALVYHNKDYLCGGVTVAASDDKQQWREVGALKNDAEPTGDDHGPAIALTVLVGAETRYLKFALKRREGSKRLLVGELLAVGPGAPKAEAPAPKVPPARPLQVKRALDEALIAAKVSFLYSSIVTDVIRDADGAPCGIVMANRAGRQAVVAKVIIDATERATVARLAGGTFRPFPAGVHAFERAVIGGKPHSGDGVTLRTIEDAFSGPSLALKAGRPGPQAYPILVYTLKLPMADASYASFARADQLARDLTSDPEQQFTSDVLFQVPPDPMKGVKSLDGGWSGVQKLDLDAFRPAGVARLFVLGGCADVSREQAEKLLRPLALMDLGARVGSAAAAETKALAAPKEPRVPGGKAEAVARGDVREILTGVRPTQSFATIPQEERPLPVLGSYDVVVIGGGTGGAPAGIAAARQGAKTLVVEYLSGLGGVGTLGAISSYYHGNRVGFTKEVLAGKTSWGIEEKSEWWRSALRQAGADLWFGVLGCGAFVDGDRVAGAVVATPLGRGVVLAKVVVDSTGNADVAAAAGAPCITTDETDIALQGTGLPPRDLGRSYTNTDFTITDETDMVDTWQVLLAAKRMAGNSFDIGQLIDTRERRRIVGDFTLTIADEVLGRTHPDTVVVASSDFDTHGYTVDPYFTLQHPPARQEFRTNIPYRAMLPQDLDGILVTGLGISAHRDAVPLIRMQPDIQNGGYAAGVAASMAAKAGCPTRKIDLRALQEHLVKIGNLTESVLSDKDSFPLPDERIAQAVYNVRDNYKDVAVVLANAKQALPLLRKAYGDAPEESKLTYAHVLGVLGDGAGLPTLLGAVEAADKLDNGWRYVGMGQFGRNMSPLDTYLYALGRIRDKQATAAILKKLALLEPAAEFSHFRAIALALEQLRDPAAAGPLADLLARPGMRGHAIASPDQVMDSARKFPSLTTTEPRSNAIRELLLARALLRCGDRGGLGRQILEEYTRDYRGHLARHAAAVLKAASQ